VPGGGIFACIFAVGLLTGPAGCARDAPVGDATVWYDSASIRIAVSRAPAAGKRAWTVDPEPVLRIGGIGAGGPAALYRVSGAQLLADGSIVVADASRELRRFDPAGRYIGHYGGPGDGPGEFRHVSRLRRVGNDSLFVFDARAFRVTVFGPDGSVVRSAHIPIQPGGLYGWLTAGDGSLFLIRGSGFGIDTPDGIHAVTYTLYRVRPGAEMADSLGSWPGVEMAIRTSGRTVSAVTRLLGHNTYFATGDSVLYVGTNDRYEIERRRLDGRLVGLVHRCASARRANRALMEAVIAARLDGIDDDTQRRHTEAVLREMAPPEGVPAFRSLLVDDSGNLWVGRYALPGDRERVFDVFDRRGQWLSVVRLPSAFAPTHITRDVVLGVERDELDVESVVLLHLRRSAPIGRIGRHDQR